MILAVIPARGGSKRIPKKNIREFAGKPVIGFSVEAARQSGLFQHIIVSTDCPDTAQIARQLGAEVPFVRPPELSDDRTPTIPVVRHAIQWANDHFAPVSYACVIYATAPFVDAQDLRSAYERLVNSDAEFAVSVTSYAFPIFRSLKIEQGRTAMFWPEHEMTRSQDLPEAYHDAGQFYWGTADAWLQRSSVFTSQTIPVVLPRHRVQDIDTPEDWQRAEAMFRASGQFPGTAS